MILTLIIVLVCLAIACWIVSVLPVPASPFPIKSILYVLIGICAILYLLKFAGLI